MSRPDNLDALPFADTADQDPDALPFDTPTPTVWVVYCPTHREYLRFVGASGTTWTLAQVAAKRYDVKADAIKAAKRATWLDHDPTPWALAGEPS